MRKINLISWLLWLAALSLSLLPMVETLNDMAALLAMRLGFEKMLMGFTPIAARYIAAILQYIFKIPVSINGSSIYLEVASLPYEVDLDWNCLGWQGLVLTVIALLIALQGDYTTMSKVKGLFLGLEVFVAANTARILIPCLLLIYIDYNAALFFHNYLATSFILSLTALYWHLCTSYILKPEGDIEGSVKFKEVLTGRRGLGLVSMAIILLAILYSGVGLLSASIEVSSEDRTALTFEFAKPEFRYLTHPDWTDLGKKAHTDKWKSTGTPGWYKLWEFDLYGPLVKEYRMEGNIIYYVYLYASRSHEAPFRFYVYDIDPSNPTSPVLVHIDDFEIRLDSSSPKEPIELEGEPAGPYIFVEGHIIRIRIDVYDEGQKKRAYYLDYDSEDKHSFVDFPGLVVEEKILPSLLPLIIALLLGVRRR